MDHRNNELMIGYWSSLRMGHTAPAQSDIEPRLISRVLPTVFILDASNPSEPLYRLAGTALCSRFGSELRGKSFLAHWDTPSSETLCWLLRRALKVHRPVCLHSGERCMDAGIIEVETVLAPISIGDSKPTRFIGLTQILSRHAELTGLCGTYQSLSASHLVCESEIACASNNSLSQLSFAKYPLSVRTDAVRWMRA